MKIHSQGNRWFRKKQSGIIVRVWESKCRLGEEIREERTGFGVWRQMTECCWGGAVGGGKGNGSNVFMHKGWRTIRKIPLLSTLCVLLGSDGESACFAEEAEVTCYFNRLSISDRNKPKLS